MSSIKEHSEPSDDHEEYQDWLDVSDDDGLNMFLNDSKGWNTVHRKGSYRSSMCPSYVPHSATPYVKSSGRGSVDRAVSVTPVGSYEDERNAGKRRRAHSIQMGSDSKYNNNFMFDHTNLSRSDSVSSVLNFLESNIGISPTEIMEYVLTYCKKKQSSVNSPRSSKTEENSQTNEENSALRHCGSCTCHLSNQNPQVKLQEQEEIKKDLPNQLVENGNDITKNTNQLNPQLDPKSKENFTPLFSSSPTIESKRNQENEKTLTPKISHNLEVKGRCLESDFENCLNEEKQSASSSSSTTLRSHHPTPFDVNVIQIENPDTKEIEEEEDLVPIFVTVHCPRKPPKNNRNMVYTIGKVVVSTPMGKCLPPRPKRDEKSTVIQSSSLSKSEKQKNNTSHNPPMLVELQGTVRWLD